MFLLHEFLSAASPVELAERARAAEFADAQHQVLACAEPLGHCC